MHNIVSHDCSRILLSVTWRFETLRDIFKYEGSENSQAATRRGRANGIGNMRV